MVPGTGPGRGLPWWRAQPLVFLWRATGVQGPEPLGVRREGHTVAVVRPERHEDWRIEQ